MMEIIVNSTRCQLEGDVLTYERAVELADTGRKAVHSVIYRHGGDALKPEGVLAPGESVPARAGMIVNAMVTDNA